MKLLRKPKLAAGIAVTADILLLAAAVVLSAIRGRFQSEYIYSSDPVAITASHPYDHFGIAAALVLVLAAVMTAFIVVGAVGKAGKNGTPQLVGGIALIVFSTAAVLFAWLVVRGQQPRSVEYLAYTDETLHIVVMEEQYTDALGAAKVFSVDPDSNSASLLAVTDIAEFADGNEERYALSWVSKDVLKITFIDGFRIRELQLDPYT